MKNRYLLFLFILVPFIFEACETKSDMIPKSELLNLPSVTVRDLDSRFTDTGRIQLRVVAPLLEQYTATKESQYSEFKKGIKAIFYEGKPEPVAIASGKYAKYTNAGNLWELRDSVVVLNENNDKLETEILYWDQEKDLIYTDRFVKITSEDQIIQGIGFESDSRLTKRKIKKVTATIYLPT